MVGPCQGSHTRTAMAAPTSNATRNGRLITGVLAVIQFNRPFFAAEVPSAMNRAAG